MRRERQAGVQRTTCSKRVTVSPEERQKAINADGPPTRASSRLAHVLSLYSTAALHISATDIAPLVRFFSPRARTSRGCLLR